MLHTNNISSRRSACGPSQIAPARSVTGANALFRLTSSVAVTILVQPPPVDPGPAIRARPFVRRAFTPLVPSLAALAHSWPRWVHSRVMHSIVWTIHVPILILGKLRRIRGDKPFQVSMVHLSIHVPKLVTLLSLGWSLSALPLGRSMPW